MHRDNRNGCDSAQGVKFIDVWTGLLPLPADNLLVVLCDHYSFHSLKGEDPTQGVIYHAPTASLFCKSRCATLPRAFFGSASTAMKATGTLCALSLCAAYSRSLWANSGLQRPFTTI